MKYRRSQHAKDLNQDEIVEAYESVGASVAITSGLGGGFPDIVVGFNGSNFLIEIKRLSSRKANSFKLTDKEAAFAKAWHGSYHVVTDISEALAVIGITRQQAQPINHAVPRLPTVKRPS